MDKKQRQGTLVLIETRKEHPLKSAIFRRIRVKAQSVLRNALAHNLENRRNFINPPLDKVFRKPVWRGCSASSNETIRSGCSFLKPLDFGIGETMPSAGFKPPLKFDRQRDFFAVIPPPSLIYFVDYFERLL